MTERGYTAAEAAKQIDLSRSAIRARMDRGTIQFYRDESGARRIPESELKRISAELQPRLHSTMTRTSVLDQASKRFEEERTPEDVLKAEVARLEEEKRQALSLLKRYEKVASIEDRIVDRVESAIMRNPYKPRIARPKIKAGHSDPHEFVLLVSDAHYGEVVRPEETMGIEYNPEITKERMAHIVATTLRYKQLHEFAYPISKITVAVLGDMLSGNIHEELAETNEIAVTQAATEMGYLLHDMGSIFANEFPEVELIIMPGNHPRLKKKPYFKHKWDNYEYLMGQITKALARDDFLVNVPKDMVYIHNVLGFRIGFTHGDGVQSSSFAGIPLYGLRQRREAIQALLNHLDLPRLDMLCMGHFHNWIHWSGTDCDIVVNGAIKGGDEYSIGTRYAANRPVQALMTFHEDHGLTGTDFINFD